MNRTISVGNLTDDPKVTHLEDKVKAEFTLALNRINEGADFPRFVAWGKRAETIEKWCRKGQKLAVIGHIHTGSYENNEGKKVYTTDIVVDEFEFCGRREEPRENPADQFVVPDGIDEEIPFN